MSLERYEAFRADPAQWRATAIDIARSHALPSAELEAFSSGTNLVAALDRHLILKIYPPMLRHQFEAERASLSLLAGRLDVATPRLVLEGERDGWPYLVITRLQGLGGEVVWPALSEPEKEDVLEQLGGLIAQVQRVPPGQLLALEPRWTTFLSSQLEGCLARHQRLGLPGRLLAGVEAYLRDAPRLLPVNVQPVILTGEYIPENLLLEQRAAGWRVCGLIDFGDVMTGWGEYDLLGPSTFMGGGAPGRVRRLLRGYGYQDAQIDPALSRRLMLLYLLHRFSEPARQVRIERWQERASSLPELERLIWPV